MANFKISDICYTVGSALLYPQRGVLLLLIGLSIRLIWAIEPSIRPAWLLLFLISIKLWLRVSDESA